jgi:hypothetical protein
MYPAAGEVRCVLYFQRNVHATHKLVSDNEHSPVRARQDFELRSYAISFVTDVLTKVDVPFQTGRDHAHLKGAFNSTRISPPMNSVRNPQVVISRFFALPIARKRVNYPLVWESTRC